ncbi:MAG: dehydrogenase [Paludibacteraceae bacterium]|nr:dehydrogenase [Paludibacteraceae bacterium]
MADNYLEKHYADYERRKAEWLKKQKKASSWEQKDPWRDL